MNQSTKKIAKLLIPKLEMYLGHVRSIELEEALERRIDTLKAAISPTDNNCIACEQYKAAIEFKAEKMLTEKTNNATKELYKILAHASPHLLECK